MRGRPMTRSSKNPARLVDQALESVGVEDAQVAVPHFDETLFGETRERAAHRLELEAEIAADLLARHAQHELRAGEAARVQALHEIEQEGCEALFRAHA